MDIIRYWKLLSQPLEINFPNLKYIRAFVSVRVKIYVYFSIRTYFFYFYILTFQKTLHHIIYFTLHFIKITNFLYFFNYFSFFTHNNHHQLFSFILKI